MLNNTQKKQYVEKLSPHFRTTEISKLLSIPESSVSYYTKKYNVPTYNQSQKVMRQQIQAEHSARAEYEKRELLQEVLSEIKSI